jgi:hypothetical protein
VTRHLPAALASIALLSACASPSGGSVSGSVASSPPGESTRVATQAASASASPAVASATPAPVALTWSPMTAAGPAAREDHTWTVDPDGRTAYLFGGRDGGTAYDDLWAYDLEDETWAMLEPGASPSARFGHEAAWVAGVGLVVFGGQAGTSFFNDLWAFDPGASVWTELPAAGEVPVARYGTCSAVGSDGRLWISHGFTSDGIRFDDTRAYDFDAGAWADESPAGTRPVERCLHSCWLTDAGSLALYAGQTTGVAALGDRWTLADGGWTQSAGALPPERNLPAHVRLDASTLIFGGMALDLGFLADLWLLRDDEADAELLTPDGPAPSGRAGAALIRDGERILLFGGRTAEGASAELWALDGLEVDG